MRRDKVIKGISSFLELKLSEMAANNPLILFIQPMIIRILNNNIGKVDDVLKLLEDSNGNIDAEGMLQDMINNLLTAQHKYYPDFLNGVSIGDGKISLNIPVINKVMVFDSTDIQNFINHLKTR